MRNMLFFFLGGLLAVRAVASGHALPQPDMEKNRASSISPTTTDSIVRDRELNRKDSYQKHFRWRESDSGIWRQENLWVRPHDRQDNRIVFFLDKKQGVADTLGNVLLEPVWDWIFYNPPARMAVVIRDEGRGMANIETGELIAPAVYYNLSPFSEGLALASRDGKLYGFLDTTGQWAIAPQWNHALSFENGMAKVFLAETEEECIAIAMQADLDIYPTPGRTGYIDPGGEYIIPPEYSYISSPLPDVPLLRFTRGEYHCDELNGFCFNPYAGSKWGLMDMRGNIVLPDDEYDLICPFSLSGREVYEYVYLVEKAGAYGLLDPRTMEMILPLGSFSTDKELQKKVEELTEVASWPVNN